MIFDKLFDKGGKEFTIKDVQDGKAKPVYPEFKKLKDRGAKYTENFSVNYKEIERFYDGDHWHAFKLQKPALTLNSAGEAIYDFSETFENHNASGKPQRTINLIKSRIESLVAYHAETSPLPVAVPKNDYNYDADLINKINLLLKQIFEADNSLLHIYEISTREAYKYGHHVVRIFFDKEYSDNNELPLKFDFVRYEDIKFDPDAESIQYSDYVIHTQHMTYDKMMSKYYYKAHDKDYVPENDELVDVDNYWIRVKKNGKTIWLCFAFYGNEPLEFVSGKEKVKYISMVRAPFVAVRHTVTPKIHGKTFVPDLIPAQIEYNMTLSEYDWNWRRYIDPTIITNDTVENVKNGQRPNGIITLNQNKEAAPWKYDLISAGDFEGRKQSIEADMDKIMGSISALQGQKGAGVYANSLFQSIKEGQETIPKMREKILLDCLDELATITLELTAEYLGARKIKIFDPINQRYVDVGESDIKDSRYKIDVQVWDSKLMTKEQRFAMLEKLLQYAKFGEKMPAYYIARMFEGHARGLIPQDVLNALKTDMNAQSQAMISPPIQQGGQQVGALPPAPPSENMEMQTEDIDNDTFVIELDNKVKSLEQFVGKDMAEQIIGEIAGVPYQDLVDNPDLYDGNKTDFLNDIELALNKTMDATSQAQ